MMQDYYQIQSEDFSKHSRIDFQFVKDSDDLNVVIFRELAETIKANSQMGKMTKVVFPVGPLDFRVFADICNQENVCCDSLVVFAMDEYVLNDQVISIDHPMSFRAFFQENLINQLDVDKRFPDDQLIMPGPDNKDRMSEIIEKYDGIDITYGGFGINGHFAFNSYPDGEVDNDTFASSVARIVRLREGDIVQNAMAGTWGNLEIIPETACTLGMSELLSADQIHLTFMRTWHSGVLRRALFGPITTKFPGSLIQLHSNVKATITKKAAQLPAFSLRLLAADK